MLEIFSLSWHTITTKGAGLPARGSARFTVTRAEPDAARMSRHRPQESENY